MCTALFESFSPGKLIQFWNVWSCGLGSSQLLVRVPWNYPTRKFRPGLLYAPAMAGSCWSKHVHTPFRVCQSVWLLSSVRWEIWWDSDEKDFAICIAFLLTSFRLMSRLWTPRFKKSVKSSNECRMHCRRGDRSAVLQGSVRVYSMDESWVISRLVEDYPKSPIKAEYRNGDWKQHLGPWFWRQQLHPRGLLKVIFIMLVQGDWRRWALLVLRFLGSLPRPQADSPSTRA